MRSLVSIYVDRKKVALYNYSKLILEGDKKMLKLRYRQRNFVFEVRAG